MHKVLALSVIYQSNILQINVLPIYPHPHPPTYIYLSDGKCFWGPHKILDGTVDQWIAFVESGHLLRVHAYVDLIDEQELSSSTENTTLPKH